MTLMQTLMDRWLPWHRSHQDVIEALETTERLLRKYNHRYLANLVAAERQGFSNQPHKTCSRLNSDEWWGPGDSIAGAEFTVDGGFSITARRDSHTFKRCLTTVYHCMKAYGQYNSLAEMQIAQFDKWMRSNVGLVARYHAGPGA